MAQIVRQQEIVKLVKRQGFASVESLAEMLGVTAQTIRRDINQLSDEGLLSRHHGGASLPSSAENLEYDRRKILNLAAKQRIAQMVAAVIPDHASLFINLGTTTEEVAKKLISHKGLRVITNNLNVASAMASAMGSAEGVEVIVAGGRVRSRDLGITGGFTVDFVREFKVDYGVIGISGIEEDGTLRDFDYDEVRVSTAIMQQSRRVLLVADHSKFGRNALVRLGNLQDVDMLFTDQPPPATLAEALAEGGVEVCVCAS